MRGGTRAEARSEAASHRRRESDSDSSKTRRCSLVQPDGPAAAPRRRFCRNLVASTWSSSSGWKEATSSERGRCRTCGAGTGCAARPGWRTRAARGARPLATGQPRNLYMFHRHQEHPLILPKHVQPSIAPLATHEHLPLLAFHSTKC